MEYDIPRSAIWTGDAPSDSCFDPFGPLDSDGPLSMGFNVIPHNTPLASVVNHLKANGGLKAYASCMGNRVGTVTTEAIRLVNVRMSDQDMARLIDSLRNQPNGYIIYDIKHTEIFSDAMMWNAVTENAPGQEKKSLYIALCYNFAHVAEILDDYVKTTGAQRKKCNMIAESCVICTIGMSHFICGNMAKKYSLPNKINLPKGFGPMYFNGLFIA